MSEEEEIGLMNRRFYIIMISLIAILVIVTWIKYDSTPNVAKDILENKKAIENSSKQITRNSEELNQTNKAVGNLSHNVRIAIANQKTIANAVSQVGSIVSQISNDTGLIPEIKFDTSKVLNTTSKLYNVTVSNDTIPFSADN